jgi:predicted SnoaL-like aldol condensation-catalyzing enzyme
MTTTTPISDWVVERLRTADLGGIAERYAANVLLDMNVPMWRVQLQGRDAASQVLDEQLSELRNLRTTWVRATNAGDTVVAEYELRWDGADGEHLSRAVSIFRLANGQIVEHSDYCCGEWTPEDIAKNKAEAPIVRW